MDVKRILTNIREGEFAPFYAWFLAKTIWPLLHRDLGKANATKVMAEDWDYLIVLDACRYDTFREVVDGSANYVISGGTNTSKWLEWNFTAKHKDVIYIAGNPYLASANLRRSLGFNPFYMVKEVWNYGWDSNLKTVPPEQVTDAALDTLKIFPEKRMIIHYIQPHRPYIADRELLEMDDGTWHTLEGGLWAGRNKTTPLRLARRGEASIERIKKAYKENLRIVMKEMERLKEQLPGRVILTADHGEAFGEHGIYGHGGYLRTECLVKVPWVILKDEKKQALYKEPAVERRKLQDRIMKLKESGRL
jgi:hypothetical protein